jgi:hypothetical protein
LKDIRYSRKAGRFRKYFITSVVGLSLNNTMFGVGGIFMTSYLVYLGVTAPQIGFLAAIPNLTNVIQVFAILLYRKFKTRKWVILGLRVFKYFFLYSIIVVPRLVTGEFQFMLVAACYFFGHLFRAMAGGGVIDWNGMFVPPEIKGRHFSKRNLIGNASYIIVSMTLGRIFDSMEQAYSVYLIILGITLVFALLELVMYLFIDDYRVDLEEAKPVQFKKMITQPLKNPGYRAFMMFSLSWMFARLLAAPYFTYYSKTVLMLDYTYIALMGSIVAFLKIIASRIWGGIGDKKGWRKIMALSGYVYAGANLLWAFTNEKTLFLYPVVILLTGIFMIGANITVFNLNFELSPDGDRILFFGFRASIVGIFAFIAPNLAGWVVDMLSSADMAILGFPINGYQIVFFASAVLQFVAVRQFVVYLKRKRLGERHT